MSERIHYQQAAPAGYKALVGVHAYVSQCGLDATLVDLVYLRVSLINGCAYCIDLHTRDLRKHGVAVEKIVLVPGWHEAKSLFSAREQAALAWAESVTRVAQTGVPDSDYQAAASVFGEKELADLTIAIGLMNSFNRLAISFRNVPAAALAAQG
ncbi:carboxymuconolactone decarboxylase family protein [Burkholderia glumae]|uniref:carboxymuconolactone decarboxylase family protein n=1 Tax=Burkholderia glumae TaxID=337 RepID=UPI001463A9CD|nr:carboxymuconolactone decarboxylase family protein [Burkholderia glumae]QJP69384.1 carboxymuconolactone decarboxylase family protein [Burkholderia glumae]